MNEISTTDRQLPNTVEDLAKFVLIGREKLNAVRAEIRAIEKVQLAAEVHEQKLQEAQEIAEAVLDAETKLGELTSQMETAQGKRKDLELVPISGTKSKKEQLADLGISHHERFETLAKHPKVVEQAKADARANGRIVTRQDVLNRIAPPKSHNQIMREFRKQAKDEHEAFKEKAKESVVDFGEIKKDKENTQIVISETKRVFNSAFNAVKSIDFLKKDDVDEMIKNMSEPERRRMSEQANLGIKILSHLIRKLGE